MDVRENNCLITDTFILDVYALMQSGNLTNTFLQHYQDELNKE